MLATSPVWSSLRFIEAKRNGDVGPGGEIVGLDRFVYTISDGQGGKDTATVTIIVNSSPVAEDDSAAAGGSITIFLFTNDSDPDADQLALVSVDENTPVGARVVDNGNSSVTYSAPQGFIGEDEFGYTVADGFGAEDTAKVSVVVFTPGDTGSAAAPAEEPESGSERGSEGGGGGVLLWELMLLSFSMFALGRRCKCREG